MSNLTHDQLLDAVRRAIVPRNPQMHWVVDNLLFLHVGGSRLYGTHTADSDWDVRGVTLAPKSYWVGARTFEQAEAQVPELRLDIVIYDVRKWLHLTVNVNPNVVETLYVPADSPAVIRATPAWQWIAARTRTLISRRAHAGYHGYATSQLKKMMVKQANKTGRREIADAHGFDTKFAMHGFRLARQGIELLRTGTMTFPRPDADQLRRIRDGLVYVDSETCVADWEREAAELDQALGTSCLPEKADFEAYDRLLIDIYDRLVAPAGNGTAVLHG
jgi:predicted nucleotidyltransferase